MNLFMDFVIRLESVINKKNIKMDEYMKDHTSFKVGGVADIIVTPETVDEVISIIKLCKEDHVPHYIIGFGSNLLVRDGGIRGVVIKLEKLNSIVIEGEELRVQCGASLAKASREALNASLTGLEFACGIPGTVGGAVAMNAGAYGGEINDVIEEVIAIDNDGNLLHLNKEQLELGYRTSTVLKHGYIAIQCIFKLKKGNYKEIKDAVDALMKKRSEKQPLNYPSAGSTFKRPVGHFAGKLIEDSGLKGFSLGGAEVSEKHSGFIINKNNATSEEILSLIKHVQKTVKERFGVNLETEVRIIGEEVRKA